MDYNKFVEKYFDDNDESGFNDVLFERQKRLAALRERLKKYYLHDDEIDKLFEIIMNSEIKMEEVKRSFKTKNYTPEDLAKFEQKLLDIQNKMKEDFDKALNATLKAKYENAKKILKERGEEL